MLVAAVVVTPLGGWQALPAAGDPVALLAGLGAGFSSSVIPYISDQLALRGLDRATYALMVSLLPAAATVIGVAVLTQIPTLAELGGVALVVDLREQLFLRALDEMHRGASSDPRRLSCCETADWER
jgi:inner membrane transporter RhtA